MQKKVKQKSYKSKREFQDDLDLIWSNCFTYNALEVRRITIVWSSLSEPARATQGHPIRMQATRLKAKAELLLRNITDRKERLDPHIPTNLATKNGTVKVNGINGHSVARPRPVAFTKSPSPNKLPAASAPSRVPRRDVPFPESSAIVRTAEDMLTFRNLDRELDARLDQELATTAFGVLSLEEKLKEYVVEDVEKVTEDGGFAATDVGVGEKRKL